MLDIGTWLRQVGVCLFICLACSVTFAQIAFAGGTYRADCTSVGPISPEFTEECNEAIQKGQGLLYKFSAGTSGDWNVTIATPDSTETQMFKATVQKGYSCLTTNLVLVCQVPRDTALIGFDSSVRSRSGVVMGAVHVGIWDLIKID